jgi:hypothetical protein
VYRLTTILVCSLGVAAPPAAKTPKIPKSLQAAIDATRHAVEADGPNGFVAHNPEQQLDLRFDGASAAVGLKDTAAVSLRLAAFGRGDQLTTPSAAVVTASKNRIEYRRGVVTEWYVNGARGLEQGFTLTRRPAGEGGLVLALAVEGGAAPRLETSNTVVLEHNGTAILCYSGLQAMDAHGRTLPAGMEVNGDEIHLKIQDRGAAYPVTIDPWLQRTKLIASEAGIGDGFGSPVALSGDTALVGATGTANNTGAAYVFVRNGTVWSEQAKLTASDGVMNDSFGYSVAVSGDTAFVGTNLAEAVYVFVRNGTVWTEQAKLTDPDGPGQFGKSLALIGDTALVGASGQNATGAAYVFVRNGTVWTEQAMLTASDGVANDQFGWSVALSGDTALVGAYGKANETGAAYVYMRSGTVWSEQAQLSVGVVGGDFGWSVALSGDTALVGASFASSAAYVFVRNGTVWTEQAMLTAPDLGFSTSVALSGDTALVGDYYAANFTGAAFVFVRTGTVWTEQSKLTASDGYNLGYFGRSVALSADTALVGTDEINNVPPAVYVFGLFQATAGLIVTPSSGPPGTTLTLSGSGFAPLETVNFYTYANGYKLGSATADGSGNAIATTRVAVTTWGRRDLVATGQSSGLSGTAPVIVTPRLVLSPTSGAAGSTFTVQGYGFGAGEPVGLAWGNPRVGLYVTGTDGKGSFPPLTVTVPAGAVSGVNAVFGQGQWTGAVGKARFTVK